MTETKKYVSTFEVVVHVYHDNEHGNDIGDEDVVKQLEALTKNVKEDGYTPWMQITYTEET